MHILSFCKFIQQSSSGFYYLQAFFYTSNKLNIFNTQNIIHYNAKTAHTPADQREESWDTYCQNRMLTDALNQEPSILYTTTERYFLAFFCTDFCSQVEKSEFSSFPPSN